MMHDCLITYPPNGTVVRERSTGRIGVIIGTQMSAVLVEWDEHPLTLKPMYRGWQSWHGYGALELVDVNDSRPYNRRELNDPANGINWIG